MPTAKRCESDTGSLASATQCLFFRTMAKLPSILSPLLSTLEPTNGDADDGADSGCSQAVVLVMLYPGRDGPSFLLTVRPDHLRTHAGQVSLPGGRVEPD